MFDVRLVGAIVVALIILAELLTPESAQSLAQPWIAQGDVGIQVTSFAFSPTGDRMATTNTSGRVALRAREKGWQTERSLDFRGYACAVAFSPDGRLLAVGGYASSICLWDLRSASCEPATTMVVPIRRATHLLFSPDGKSLAFTTNHDGTVFLWDLEKRRERIVINHPSTVSSIAFSPDGRWLATGGRDDRSIILWSLETGARSPLLENGPGPTIALAFSPYGALLASANVWERHVRLWDLNTRRECRIFVGHTRSLNSVAFSPDGLLLATAGNDGMLGLWEVATGERLVSLEVQATSLRTVAFSPDGRTVVLASSNDDNIRLWDLDELLPGPA